MYILACNLYYFACCFFSEPLIIIDYPENPCVPSPCGQFSDCRVINNRAVCSCISNYIGPPPNCRPECTINAECASTKACVNQRCKDPCPGSCGYNAECRIISHSPVCFCSSGFTGDPFSGCQECKRISFKLLTQN